ncbi:MAG: hypothetical protein ACOCT0_03575 [Halobacteriota archaeon]
MASEAEDGLPSCPRCGSTAVEREPDTDIPGFEPDYGCTECMNHWEEDSGFLGGLLG